MKNSSTSFRFSSLLFFFIVAASNNVVYSEDAASIVVNSETARDCPYTLIVQTGKKKDAGTDSRISVTLSNSDGQQFDIPDLKEWGIMPPGYDYFENGNRDRFRGDASVCLYGAASVCKITVTSDGSGQKPGWFLEDVDVVTLDFPRPRSFSPQFPGSLRTKINFHFDQWLAKDEPPYKLTVTINKCT